MRSATFPGMLFIGGAVLSWSAATPGQSLEKGLARLRSTDPIDRHGGEAELLQAGRAALPALAREIETVEDRLLRFRLDRVFSEILESLLTELESEHRSLSLDRHELKLLADRKAAYDASATARASYESWKARRPDLDKLLERLVSLERLEEREKRVVNNAAAPLPEEAQKELEELRSLRATIQKDEPELAGALESLVRYAKLAGLGPNQGKLSDLETLRLKELEERVANRAPKVENLRGKLKEAGFPALNGCLARSLAARERAAGMYAAVVPQLLEGFRKALPEAAIIPETSNVIPETSNLEAVRYSRSLVWAWEVDKNDPRAGPAAGALARHTELTLKDLDDPELLIHERAADELYLLGQRGKDALEKKGGNPFLQGLLRWRIRPRTYGRVGIDFEDYPRLAFREKRRKIFHYANVAREEGIPTLRAIVADDGLESSFYVKLAAAKALAGLQDMSGYNYLVLKHPDLALKRPWVSRDLLIIQAYELIQEKDYPRAVEELQKILDEYPFDFSANYHIAFAYLLLKNYSKSIHHFEIARRINAQDQLTLYNLACAYALAGGKTAEALEALEASVKAGFDDHKHIEEDPDLESLRDQPRYDRLLEGMKGSVKP